MVPSHVSFSDRLAEAVRRKGPLCVGPTRAGRQLPKEYREKMRGEDGAPMVGGASTVLFPLSWKWSSHSRGIVEPQAAFFEIDEGMFALHLVLQCAKRMGFVTILDAKRGDIASTAQPTPTLPSPVA